MLSSKLLTFTKILALLACAICPWCLLMYLVNGLPIYSQTAFKDPDFPHLVPLFVLIALGCLGIWLAVSFSMKKWRKRILVFLVAVNALISLGIFSFSYDFEYYEWTGSNWRTTNWLHTEESSFTIDDVYGDYLMARSIGHRLAPVFDPSGKKVGIWRGGYEQRVITLTAHGNKNIFLQRLPNGEFVEVEPPVRKY